LPSFLETYFFLLKFSLLNAIYLSAAVTVQVERAKKGNKKNIASFKALIY